MMGTSLWTSVRLRSLPERMRLVIDQSFLKKIKVAVSRNLDERNDPESKGHSQGLPIQI